MVAAPVKSRPLPAVGTTILAALVLLPSLYVALAGGSPLADAAGYGPTVPSEPQDLTVQPILVGFSSCMLLNWNPPESWGGAPDTPRWYTIYQAQGTVAEPQLIANLIATPPYTDCSTLPQTEYCYQVSATNSVGEGPRSAKVCDTTL